MKKLFIFLAFITATVALSGCTNSSNNDLIIDETETLGSEASLATLSYLSTGFLDYDNTSPAVSNVVFLSSTEEPVTTIDGELDQVNIYIDRLKVLIENGVESFGSVLDEESDNELYDFKLTFTVNEEVYIIYYNIDDVTQEMTGVIVIGAVEYEFEVMDNIKTYEYNYELKHENKENDDEDEDTTTEVDTDDEDEDESIETKMVLIATNGLDTIKVTYKTELEDGEFETKFYMEQTIDGITKEIALKISEEEGETKVKVTDGDDEYTFKKELEEEGTVYKLQYRVDGVVGMVKITEIIADDGTITYDYFIQEAGMEKHTEKEEPKSHGFDDDDDDNDDDEIEDEEDEV